MKKFRLVFYLVLFLYAICPVKTANSPENLASSNKYDKRVEILDSYYKDHESPLAGYGSVFVSVADRYNFDWRLLPAISGAESTFGKHTPSCAKYNVFGWTSLTSPCGFWRFESYDEAIRYVAAEIATEDRYANFRNTGGIEELSVPYNNGNEAWVEAVNFFVDQIK